MNNSESYMDRSSSFSRNTSCGSFDDDKWQKEFKMHEDCIPSELKIKFFDVMVLYSENNRADARKFCDHLKNDIKLKHDKCVNAALYDEFLPQAGSRCKLLEKAIERSTYIFFFMTKEFCEDTWIELSRAECLMEAIYNEEKKWCVVPVYTEKPEYSNFNIPVYVRVFKGIDYYCNDEFYKLGVRGLIQNRLYQRLEKEKKQKELQYSWLQKNKRQFSNKIENIKSLEYLEKLETQQEMEQKIKGKDMNEVVLTGASQEHQRSTTYQGAENSINGDLNSQTWEHQSQENDMTVNNSMQSVDHPFQEESTNLTEPASEGPSVFGNLPNMFFIDSQDFRMATGTMNLSNEDKKPLQGENPTGTSHDKTGGKDVHAEIDTEESKSNFDGGTRHMELEKYKNFMPSDIKIDYFDVMVLYSEVNKSDARTFCDHLKMDIKLKHNESVKAVLYDECAPQAGSKFNLLKTAFERCTYVFCYITKEFCEDKWTELSREECLIETIENVEKQWCVVPVLSMPTETLPCGLKSLSNIKYYENNQFYRDKVSALIQNSLHRRLDKERKQKEQQFTWIKKNKGALHFGNEDTSCQENKEKLGTKQQEKEKSSEQGVNEGLIPSQPLFLQKEDIQTFREGTYHDNGYHSDQSVEPVSHKDDPSDNICIKPSADPLYQGGSSNLMQPAVHKFASNGNQSDMPLLDVLEECSDGAKFAECLQDIGLFSLNPDVDGMHSKSDDQSQDTQMTPVNQSTSCWGTEVTVEEEEDQSLETNSKDESMSVKKTKEKKEQHLETKSKDHSMLETKSKDHSMLETKSKDHSMSVKKTKEGNEHYSSLSEKDLASEMKKDQDVHLWHKANSSNEKQVAIVTPSLKVCKDRDGEKTDLDIVDRETNGDTGVKTIHETRETTSYETEQTLPKIVDGDFNEISPFRERPYTDLSRYHVARRPATPLLAKASPIPPVNMSAVCLVQSNRTSTQCTKSSKGTLSQDELD